MVKARYNIRTARDSQGRAFVIAITAADVQPLKAQDFPAVRFARLRKLVGR